MAARLTKPLVVPEFTTGVVKLYEPDASGLASVNAQFTTDLNEILLALLGKMQDGSPYVAQANSCRLHGTDLFVSLTSQSSQSVIKLPGYLSDPALAKTKAFIFTLDGSDYVGMAIDAAGYLYVAEGSYPDNTIVRYGGVDNPYPGSKTAAAQDNYTGRSSLGNAGKTSYFGDLVFDSGGNLWVADYLNHRVVVFDAAGLGGANTFHVLDAPVGTFAVANTNPPPPAPPNPLAGSTTALFSEPEGLDFDGFGPTANLWVANNNDGGGTESRSILFTTIVKITPALQQAVLATGAGRTIPAAQIVPNTNCFIYQFPVNGDAKPKFGGLQIDKAAQRLYVNEEASHNGRAFDLATIAATPTTATDSLLAITSTDPGNGGIALLELGAYVADGDPMAATADLGFEPDTTGAVPWESGSISIIQSTTAGALAALPPAEDVEGGQSCALYIEVRNFGSTPTLGIETLNVRWANGSTGLHWPDPWDGSAVDAAGAPTGGTIASKVAIPVIAPFAKTVVGPIGWMAPDPEATSDKLGHFCLLARVVTPLLASAGMSFPETGDIVANTLNNARIAWRNIHIIDPVTGKIVHRAGVILANYTGRSMTVRVAFEVLGSDGLAMPRPLGYLSLEAKGASRAALARVIPGAGRGEGPIVLRDISKGFGGLHLSTGMQVAFVADFVSPEIRDYVLRVSQFAQDAGGETLIGGQSFVKGIVAGFPVAPPKTRSPPPPPTGGKKPIPDWLWLLLALLAIAALLSR